MSNYATLKSVKNLKKAMNESFKDIFHMKDMDELTQSEQKAYAEYTINEAMEFAEGEAWKNLSGHKQRLVLSAHRKLKGDQVDEENSKEAIDVLKEAYKNHMTNTKPKWYQLFKRYAYWKEEKALDSFEAKLVHKGIDQEDIDAMKESLEHTTSELTMDTLEKNPIRSNCVFVGEDIEVSPYESFDLTNEENTLAMEASEDSFDYENTSMDQEFKLA